MARSYGHIHELQKGNVGLYRSGSLFNQNNTVTETAQAYRLDHADVSCTNDGYPHNVYLVPAIANYVHLHRGKDYFISSSYYSPRAPWPRSITSSYSCSGKSRVMIRVAGLRRIRLFDCRSIRDHPGHNVCLLPSRRKMLAAGLSDVTALSLQLPEAGPQSALRGMRFAGECQQTAQQFQVRPLVVTSKDWPRAFGPSI